MLAAFSVLALVLTRTLLCVPSYTPLSCIVTAAQNVLLEG